MNNLLWFEKWDQYHLIFKWIFFEYDLVPAWEFLLDAREHEHKGTMIHTMNQVYLYLPKNIFNDLKNPAGWKEFTYLLQNE